MNKKQEKCVWIGIIIFVLMGIFPPWILHYQRLIRDQVIALFHSGGYDFLFVPPNNAVCIDLTRLITQWLMLSVLTAWIVYRKGDKNLKS
jgi:hypothetical protein